MSSKVEKTRARLQKRIEEGSYYEAHQQLRVLCQRYAKAENYEAAIDIVFTGAQALLKAGQSASGGDLCVLLVEVYRTAEIKSSPETRGRIIELLKMMPPEEALRKRFIKEAVAWSAKYGDSPFGDPQLQHFIGSLYAEEDEAIEAEKHLLFGTDASAAVLARLLYRWYKEDDSHTAPQYLARAVLPYLLLKKIPDAIAVWDNFTKELVQNSPSLVMQEVQSSTAEARVFPSLPLLNFLGLLVVAVQRPGQDLFRSLKAQYSTYLRDVPSWDEPLELIAEMHFGLRNHRGPNLFDIMGSMFGGGGPPSQGRASSPAMIEPQPEALD